MLKHLKSGACPVCSSKIKRMSIDNQHINGHWNEFLEFECGMQESFSPNFMITSLGVCPRSEEAKQKEIELTKLINDTNHLILNAALPNKLQDRLLRDTELWRFCG